MRVPDDWFVGFHKGLAARFWAAAGETMIDADAAIVSGLLPLGTVLDVPCGDGRLTARLVEAGYDVTGIDVSPDALERARARGLEARFVEGDLRALPDLGPFDGVVSWGNSFGYVTPPETVRSLAAFRRLVKPGGRLVLESSHGRRVAARGRDLGAPGDRVRRREDDQHQPLPREREPVGERVRVRGRRRHGRARPRRAPRAHDRRGRADAARRRVRAGRAAGRRRARTSSALGG